MSTDKNGLEVTAETFRTEPSPKIASDPIDFTAAIDRLQCRATRARNFGRKNKRQSTLVALLAAIALLMVVVGAEDVVRRQLSPDIRDVTANRLKAANQSAKDSLGLAAVKTAAANVAAAALAAIDEEFGTAQKATEEAEKIEESRTNLFSRMQDELTKKARADVNVTAARENLSAIKLSTGNDIKNFLAAETRLKANDEEIAEESSRLQQAENEYKIARERTLAELVVGKIPGSGPKILAAEKNQRH